VGGDRDGSSLKERVKAISIRAVIGKHEMVKVGMIALTYLESSPKRLQIVLKPRYYNISKVVIFVKWLIPASNYRILITRSIRESAQDNGYNWDLRLLWFMAKEEHSFLSVCVFCLFKLRRSEDDRYILFQFFCNNVSAIASKEGPIKRI